MAARAHSDDLARPTEALATFVHELSVDRIPMVVRARVKELLLDALGCALAADHAPEIAAIDTLVPLFGTDRSATVIGSAVPQPRGSASLVNGYRITALTACDVYTPAHFHVTPEVVPAALAIAEGSGSSGSDLLVALVAGFEVATRVAAGLHYPSFRARGWHTPGVAGPFGAAAAAGQLLHLGNTSLRDALGLAGSQAAGTWAAWGTPTVKFHQARGALSGLIAASLAATGFAASDEILCAPDGGILTAYSDGGDPDAITSGLGTHWELLETSIRPWPGAMPLQPVISALAALLETMPVPPSSVGGVQVTVAPTTLSEHAAFRRPAGPFEALLSIEYAVAAFLASGSLGFVDYLAPTAGLTVVHDLIERVHVEANPALDRLGARVTVVDTRGNARSSEVTVPRGHPRDPAPMPLVAAKFTQAAASSLGAEQAAALMGAVADLELLGDVTELCRLCRPAA